MRLDAATGARVGHVDIVTDVLPGEIDVVHTAVTLANGRAYAGPRRRATCRRGAAASPRCPPNVAAPATYFYGAYGHGGNFSGGGVWGWGGVSVDDDGAVYAGVGNADDTQGPPGRSRRSSRRPTSRPATARTSIKLSGDLSTVLGANDPGRDARRDRRRRFPGTPVLFKPVGCTRHAAGGAGQERAN